MKSKIEFREDEAGQKFPFLDLGSERHKRTSFRLWLSGQLLSRDEEDNIVLKFPVQHAQIETTPKGSLVLRSREDTMVYDLYVKCGYRGDSTIEILTEHGDTFPYQIFSSQVGSLGVSRGMLVNAPIQPLKFRWTRTGRTYGQPKEGITIVMPNGETKDFELVPDGLPALDELPVLED